MRAIRRASIFASREGQAIKLEFSADGGNVSLSAQSVEVGSHKSVVDCDVKGADMTLGFNSRFLLEGLDAFKSDEVVLDIKDKTAPVRLRGTKDENFMHVVMPMSLVDDVE